MPRKDRITRRIDSDAPIKHGAVSAVSGSSTSDPAPPPPPDAPDPPYGLALVTGVTYSTASPLAYISATWLQPTGSAPDRYSFQVSEGSGFLAANTTTISSNTTYATAPNLKPGTLYYARVAGVVRGVQSLWSATASITTASDTAPAGVPTSVTATWIGVGDLLITWTNPGEPNFKDVQVVIRAGAGGTIYRTTYSAVGRFLYVLAWNYTDTGGVGDSSLYVELRSRTFSNVLGTIVNTGLVTKAAPATPTGLTQSWSGDTGTAGAALIFGWADAIDAGAWIITTDTISRRVVANTFTYGIDTNRLDHGGSADPAIAYNLIARDGFGQSSSAVVGTATNAAPVAPVATLEQGAVGGLYATVTSTPPADFWRFEFVFKRDGTTVATVYSTGASYRYEMGGAGDGGYHSWTVVVRQEDLFSQFSPTHTPAAVAVEALTLGFLRDDIVFSDSIGTAPATLKAALADNATTTGGITYLP